MSRSDPDALLELDVLKDGGGVFEATRLFPLGAVACKVLRLCLQIQTKENAGKDAGVSERRRRQLREEEADVNTEVGRDRSVGTTEEEKKARLIIVKIILFHIMLEFPLHRSNYSFRCSERTGVFLLVCGFKDELKRIAHRHNIAVNTCLFIYPETKQCSHQAK